MVTVCGSLQVRRWDSGGEWSHNGGNEQLLSHPHAQAAEEQGHANSRVLAWKSRLAPAHLRVDHVLLCCILHPTKETHC